MDNKQQICSERIYYVHCCNMQDITNLIRMTTRHPMWAYVGKYRMKLKDAMDIFSLNFDCDIMIGTMDNIDEELKALKILVV